MLNIQPKINSKLASRPVNQLIKQTQVLIVEDNPVIMMILENKIKTAGCLYSKAMSGEEALVLIKTTRYDMIITDLGLPGISGLELSRVIRSYETNTHKKSTPIIGLTAVAKEKTLKDCINAGMNDVLSKPINRNTLHQIFNKYLPLIT